MSTREQARDTELRTQLAAILRANRELGAGYEHIAVDQLLDAMRGQGAPRVRRAPAPRPAQRSAPQRVWAIPWWIWALAVVAALHWGPVLLRDAGLGWIPVLLALIIAFKVLRAVGRRVRRWEARWDGRGAARSSW